MPENRYHEVLRENNQAILNLCPANQTMRVELALEIKKILEQKPDVEILELGVGEGDLTKYILEYNTQYNPEITLDCLDVSPEMIELAGARTGINRHRSFKELRHEDQNINFIQSDACEYLDNPQTKSYGIILSAWTIHNFPKKDQARVFEKIYDKLQEGGVMMIMDKIYTDDSQENLRLLRLQNARYRYLPAEVEQAIELHEYQDYDMKYKMQEGQTKLLLKEIGFRDIEILDRIERDVLLIAKK